PRRRHGGPRLPRAGISRACQLTPRRRDTRLGDRAEPAGLRTPAAPARPRQGLRPAGCPARRRRAADPDRDLTSPGHLTSINPGSRTDCQPGRPSGGQYTQGIPYRAFALTVTAPPAWPLLAAELALAEGDAGEPAEAPRPAGTAVDVVPSSIST